MIKINKNLVLFSGLFLLLGTVLLFNLQKLFPLLSHASYYCQSFISSLSLPIPYYLGIIPFLLFSGFLVIAIAKLLLIYVKVRVFRKKLVKNFRTNTQFNTLLEKLQLTNKTYLIKNEKKFAFCLGIRNPKIYISTALLDILSTKEIEVVLRHERHHLNKRDTLTMLFASVSKSLLPFFPLISDLFHNYRIEREIQADAEAVRGLGDDKPLISALKKLLSIQSATMATASAIADRDTLEPRIYMLVKKDFNFRKFSMKNILISIFSVAVMSVVTLVPVQAFEIFHQEEDVMMICPHGNECSVSCKQEYSSQIRNYSESEMQTFITE